MLLLFAILTAVILIAAFLPWYEGEDDWRGVGTYFLTILLAVWAGGLWVTTAPAPLFLAALLLSVMLAAYAPAARRRRQLLQPGHAHLSMATGPGQVVALLLAALLAAVTLGHIV